MSDQVVFKCIAAEVPSPQSAVVVFKFAQVSGHGEPPNSPFEEGILGGRMELKRPLEHAADFVVGRYYEGVFAQVPAR